MDLGSEVKARTYSLEAASLRDAGWRCHWHFYL